MSTAGIARRAMARADGELGIDVLAFPPDQAELERWRARAADRWREVERRARIALFFGVGMFLAWAADVGAAFEIQHAGGSELFGVASIPIAVLVAVSHLYARWALERASRGHAEVQRQFADVTQREATPLLELAQRDAVIEQYLRCVGRQRRALSTVERIALHAWAAGRSREALHNPA